MGPAEHGPRGRREPPRRPLTLGGSGDSSAAAPLRPEALGHACGSLTASLRPDAD